MKHMCPMDTENKRAVSHTPQAAVEHCKSRLLDPSEPLVPGRACREQVRAGWHLRVLRTAKQSPRPHHAVQPGCVPQDISALAHLPSQDQMAVSHLVGGSEATLSLGRR